MDRSQVRSFSGNTMYVKISTLLPNKDGRDFLYISLCLSIFPLLARKPNLEKKNIYSNKFFHNFHLSASSFTCPGLRIDRNFCSVHEEIISQSGCTHRITQACVQPDRGYFKWTEQIISINPYKLILFFFLLFLWYWKIYLLVQNMANNRK